MANPLHIRLSETAQRLITKHGRYMELVSNDQVSAWDDRLNGDDVPVLFKGVQVNESLITNSNVPLLNESNTLVILSGISGVSPKVGLRVDNKLIVRVSKVEPGTTVVIYEIELEG